jgi:isopentenyl-diphosphate delta-isomerase
MVLRPESVASYGVRDVAPSVLLLGNLGIVQAREMSDQQVLDLVGAVDADALCVHLNPAMELVQVDGDRDFRGGLERFAALVESLPVPVVAKETGCGLSASVAARLHRVGVRHLDVSGAGGTSWVAVETHRAPEERRALGAAFWEWGVPTAASVALAAPIGFETIFATGGLQSGLDVAKAVALGASAGGIARHVLKALAAGGTAGAVAFLDQVEAEIRTAMLLTGSADVAALRRAPRVLVGELREWISQAGPGAR